MGNYEQLNVQQMGSESDPFTESRYKQFYRYFPPHVESVLDIGCNTGRGGRVLKQLRPSLSLTALDVVQNRLDRLPVEVYSHLICASATEIPGQDNQYDVVVAGEFIEHLYPSDVDKTLAEIFRVLKIGGLLLLTTPNPLDIKRRMKQRSILGGAHVSQHFPDALRFKLRMIGYSNIRIRGSGKVSRFLGCGFPFLGLYGSYLAAAEKY